jgi:hypothetical protein
MVVTAGAARASLTLRAGSGSSRKLRTDSVVEQSLDCESVVCERHRVVLERAVVRVEGHCESVAFNVVDIAVQTYLQRSFYVTGTWAVTAH